MKKEKPQTKSKEQAQADPQGARPPAGWRPILHGAVRELWTYSWLQNLLIGLILLLVSPFIGATFMNGRKAIIVSFGVGFTILIWIGVFILLRQVSTASEPLTQPPPAPTPASPSPITPTPTATGRASTHINGYKLFYFRVNHKFSLAKLSRTTGLSTAQLRRLEEIKPRRGNQDPSLWFAPCERQVINLLEDALDARGRLESGKRDDFLTQYMLFYAKYKRSRSSRRESEQLELRFETKAVVFDFDGTLTHPGDNATTWEKIWVALGYPKEDCFDLHRRFQRREFDHRRWCDLTLEAFKARKLRREHIVEIAKGISLVDGVPETIAELRERGLKLFILSGSIKSIIRLVLGDMCEEFEEIKANELRFDHKGNIAGIEETRYDFEGKAEFIKRIIRDYGFSPSDVLFVGNDCNDVFASESGARTLCVNARLTDPSNEEHWTYAIGEMRDLHQILEYVQL